MIALHSATQNHLLASLAVDELEHLSPYLDEVYMPQGDSCHDHSSTFQYVYFPTTAVISLLGVMENGVPAEIAAVSNEGILGIHQFMRSNQIPSLAFVRSAGFGYKLKADLLLKEFKRTGSMRRLLLRYTHALIKQTSQTTSCNCCHSLTQRLCRWLLLSLERLSSNELMFKHEVAASLLGAVSEEVLEGLFNLQQAGAIHYQNGQLFVLDKAWLENHACECYALIKNEFDHFLGLDWDWRPMPESANIWSKASVCFSAPM
ncbi:MAG: Crp/Fnr family transcriptional regulator [Gallionellaceae bacterium]